MKNIHVTDDLQQNLSDLERESLITRGVGDLNKNAPLCYGNR